MKLVANIILGKADAQTTDGNYAVPGPLGTPLCMQDTCCVWKYVVDEMVAKFSGDSGRCNLYARGAVRLGFHDAGAWTKGMTYGGADGSMILTNELSRDINRGLEEIVDQTRIWYLGFRYSRHDNQLTFPIGIQNTSLTALELQILSKWVPLLPLLFAHWAHAYVLSLDGWTAARSRQTACSQKLTLP